MEDLKVKKVENGFMITREIPITKGDIYKVWVFNDNHELAQFIEDWAGEQMGIKEK